MVLKTLMLCSVTNSVLQWFRLGVSATYILIKGSLTHTHAESKYLLLLCLQKFEMAII